MNMRANTVTFCFAIVVGSPGVFAGEVVLLDHYRKSIANCGQVLQEKTTESLVFSGDNEVLVEVRSGSTVYYRRAWFWPGIEATVAKVDPNRNMVFLDIPPRIPIEVTHITPEIESLQGFKKYQIVEYGKKVYQIKTIFLDGTVLLKTPDWDYPPFPVSISHIQSLSGELRASHVEFTIL
jgi:hypothetical protein